MGDGFQLSPQQRRLWAASGDAAAVPEAVVRVRLAGVPDRTRLARARDAVALRHEALRTSYPRAAWMKVPEQAVGEEPVLEFTVEEGAPGAATLTLRLPGLGADRSSLMLLVAELAAAYDASAASGGGQAEPAEALQYGDFTAWQHELLTLEDDGAELVRAFWARYDLAPLARLRLAGQRPAAPAFAPRAVAVPLAAATAGKLVTLAGRLGVQLATLLLAAWEAFLWRLTGEPAPIVGRVFDGRKFEELAGALGLFARALPVRGGARRGRSLAELVARVAEAEAEAAGWQEYGVRDADPAAPAFPFVFEPTREPPAATFAGLAGGPLEIEVPSEPFLLKLLAIAGAGEPRLVLEHDESRLPAAAASLLAGQLAAFLASAAERPEAPLEALAMESDEERRRLGAGVLASATVAAPAPTFDAWFAAQARATPAAPALAWEGETLTYAELHERVDRFARRLRGLGVGPEVRVALYLERSHEPVVALLAVLAAGGAFVPLDPAFPGERLEKMLEDAGARVLIGGAGTREAFPGFAGPRIDLSSAEDVPSERPGQARPLQEDSTLLSPPDVAAGLVPAVSAPEVPAVPEPPAASGVQPENLAYVLFTSGSTGRPKGVAIEHRQLVSYVAAILERLAPPPGSRFATVSTFAADLGHTMIFPALASGGCLHVVAAERAANPASFAALMAGEGIDYLKIVPSHLAALLTGGEPAAERVLPKRALIVGGEATSRELAARLGAAPGGMRLLNHYGPTETTVGVLAGWVASEEDGLDDGRAWTPTAQLGAPLAGREVAIVDRDGSLVPCGVAGELLIGGEGVARGYLGRPAATAERFVPHPWSARPGERLYASGDLVRRLHDGGLEFLGRIDGQLKVRGFRIEPGEIEAVLATHPGLAEVAVVPRDDAREGHGAGSERRLVAYVVPRAGGSAGDDELARFLGARLPAYMLPAAWVRLDALPLTGNGKLDRRALATAAWAAPERARAGAATYVAPRTANEEILCAVWAQVLGQERVGTADSFFELGGDSILVIQVVARAQRAGLEIAPGDLFRYPTLGELAAAARPAAAPRPVEPLPVGPLPLTPIQRWFFDLDLPRREHWNQAVLLELRRPSPAETVHQALAALAAHHDALRLRFTAGDDGWSQAYAAPDAGEAWPLVTLDLSRLPPAAAVARLEAEAGHLQASLDLARGPLARGLLVRLGTAGTRLLLVIHHLVVDGVSWRILLEDLALALDGVALAGGATTSYGRWALQLAAQAQTAELARDAAAWRALLPAAARPLPCDFPAPDPASPTGSEASSRRATGALTAEETARLLGEVPAAYRAETLDVLLAALTRAVAGWSGEPQVLVELEGHGRDVPEGGPWSDLDLSRTVGWFTSRYPLALEAEAWRDATTQLNATQVAAVKERRRSLPMGGLSFGILRYLGDAAALAALPAPEIGFNYLGQLDRALPPGAPFAPASESVGAVHDPTGRRSTLLGVVARVAGGCLEVSLSYSADRHRPATAEALLAAYLVALRELLAAGETGAGELVPEDFPLADLSSQDLEAIAKRIGQAKG